MQQRTNHLRYCALLVTIVMAQSISLRVSAQDCNGNGILDSTDINSGTSLDCNANAVPDECDSESTFSVERVISSALSFARDAFGADLDGDGDIDAISASSGDDKIAWYENLDGQGTFGTQRIVSTSADQARSVFAIDIDGDGDTDILSASQADNKIAWYENTDGLGSFGSPHVITTAAVDAFDVFAIDIDGDGDADVLSASTGDSKVAWYENTDGLGGFGPQQVISSGVVGAIAVFATDLDGDGDIDVLAAFSNADTVGWFENLSGTGDFGPIQPISTDVRRVQTVVAGDIDGDGDMDVVSASYDDDEISWYENTDSLGAFGAPRIVTSFVNGPECVYVSDLDGDGDADILSVSDNDGKIAWYQNIDGFGTFGPQDTVSTYTALYCSAICVDLDGDGDADVLSASSNHFGISWIENTDRDCDGDNVPNECEDDCNGNRVPDECDLVFMTSSDCNSNIVPDECDVVTAFAGQQIISTSSDGPECSFAIDIDGDGDVDVLTSSWNDSTVGWFENTDGLGSFSAINVISTESAGVHSVIACDLDGDGDADVITANEGDDSIEWFENLDGLGGFGPRQFISVAVDGAYSVYAADLDGDNDIDIVSASRNDDKVAWYENTDGLATFGPQQVFATAADGPVSVFVADMNGDGRPDVLSASLVDRILGWYSNVDGLGSFGPRQVIAAVGIPPNSINAVDFDNDGDNDVLSWLFNNDLVWYENIDGLGTFGPQRVIDDSVRAPSVRAVDLDADGDADVIAVSETNDMVVWYENTDGLGTFGPRQVISDTTDEASSVFVADLDGDGVVDVLSTSFRDDKVAWYKNTSLDCNGNGIPDACDVSSGTSLDCDDNGVPDDCQPDSDGDLIPDACDSCEGFDDLIDTDGDSIPNGCDPQCGAFQIGDVDGSGAINLADLDAFASTIVSPESATTDELCASDVNEDAVVNGLDIHEFVSIVMSP